MQPQPQARQGGQLGFSMQQQQHPPQQQQQPAGMVRDLRSWAPADQGGSLTMQQLPVHLQQQPLAPHHQQQQHPPPPPPPGAPLGHQHAPPGQPLHGGGGWDAAAAAGQPPKRRGSRWDAAAARPGGGGRPPVQQAAGGGWPQQNGPGGGPNLPPPPPAAPHQQQQHPQARPPPPPPGQGPPYQQQQLPLPPLGQRPQQQPGPPQQQQQFQAPPPPGHPHHQQQQQQLPAQQHQQQQQQHQQQHQQQQQRGRQAGPRGRGGKQPRDQRPQQLPPPPQPPQHGQPPPPQPPQLPPPPAAPHSQPGPMLPGPPPSIQQQRQQLPPQAGLVMPGVPPAGGGVPAGLPAGAQVVAMPGPLPPGAVLVQGPPPPPCGAPLPQQPGMQYLIPQQQQQQGGQQQQQVVFSYLPPGAVPPGGGPGLGMVVAGAPGPPSAGQSGSSGAGGAPGPPPAAPPPPPPTPTMTALLQAAGRNLQDLLLVLKEIPRYLQATRASVLAPEDVSQICRSLKLMKNKYNPEKTAQVTAGPVAVFYRTVAQAQPQLSLEQQLDLLDCLHKLASRDGMAPAPPELVSAIATSISGSAEASDCTQFESVAQRLLQMHPNKSEYFVLPCLQALLADSVLRKLLREDADMGCGVLLALLLAIEQSPQLKLGKKLQESVQKFLQDSLHRLCPTTLAGLLTCHARLGLGPTTKLLRRAATEYQRRPEAHPSLDMLLGILEGLAAGGKDFLRELPQQLMVRLVEDVQALLPKTSGAQLLKTLTQLVQVGAIRSAKQQQALDQLLQHLGQHLLDADVLLQLPDLISSLTEAETAQSQPGLGALIRKLAAVLECKDTALAEAPPAVALRMVAGLQQEPGQLQHVQQELLPGLPAKLLASIRELSAAVTAATAAAAAAAAALADADRGAGQAVAVQEVMRLEQQQKQLMQVLSLRERVSVVEAVKQFGGNTAGTASILMPAGGEEVALLLQAMIDSEVLQYRLQQQQEPADTPAQQAGGSDGGAAAAAALLPLPMVFVTEDWQQLARLLSMCLEWFPLDLLPLPLLQLVFEVLEAQAALGGMTTCDKPSAVQLLWGLGIAGALSYELWDVLSTPLDNEAEPLGPDALLRVFEAYCLAVLRNTGPAPCLILMQQLVPAGNEFCKSVLGDGQESQHKLLQALVRAGLVPPEARATRVVDGHMMLFDVLSEESKQAWVVSGKRSALLSAAAGRLLSAAGWVQLQLSTKELDSTAGNPAQQAQRLAQLSKVADLLPRLSAMIRAYKAKQALKAQQQQQQQQQQLGKDGGGDESSDEEDDDELDEDDMQQLMQLVQYLTTSLANGTLLQPLQEKQMAYLQHIADQFEGPTQQQLPQLPLFGTVRATRQQQQQEATLAAQQKKHRGPPWALDESTLDPASLPPNSISIQEVFALNRNGPAAAAALDPAIYGHRLLALPPDAKEGTPAGAAAAAAELASRRAAAAAAFVINCRQAKAAAEVAAAKAEAAAAARALQQQQEQEAAAGGDVDMLDASAAAADSSRGRSPIRQQRKRRRHWRDSRSRSRSCSLDSATSTSTRDSSRSSGGARSDGSSGAAAGGDSEEEEGAVGSEEGQVPSGGEDDWARSYWDKRQSRSAAGASAGASAPVSFAARGVRRPPDYKRQQQQQQTTLKRGRPRSRSRSADSREWGGTGGGQQYKKQQYDDRRYRRDSRSRSCSRSRSRSRSPEPGGVGPAASAGTAAAAAAAAAAAGATAAAAAGSGVAGYSLAMAAYALRQQQQQQQAAALAAVASTAASQRQQQTAMLAAAAQQAQQFEGAGGAERLAGLFAHMPRVQARLLGLLKDNWFTAGDVKQSAIALMLQLDEAKLMSVLADVKTYVIGVRRKAAAAAASGGNAAAAAGGGGQPPKVGLHSGELNGFLVSLCRKMGAKKPVAGSRQQPTVGGLAAAAAVRGMHGMAAGSAAWSSYMQAAAAAAAAAAAGDGSSAGAGGAAAAGAAAAGTAAAAGAKAAAAAAAAGGGRSGKIGGYMLMNGMLVPVAAETAAALAARQAAYASYAGAGSAAAAAGGGSDAGAAAGGTAAAAAAGGGSGAGAGGGAKGTGKKKQSSYWDALNSGLDADGDGAAGGDA